MNNKKWKLLSSKLAFESKYLTIEDRSYELPDGKQVDGYFHLSRPDYVLIVAVNDQNEIAIEQQYRRGVDEFVYELPAGWIDKEESPVNAAKRELKEETGFIGIGDSAVEIYPQPGFCSMKAFVVILKINGMGETSLDDDENIKVKMMDIKNVELMIKNGEIKDMGFLAGFAIYKNSLQSI